jgi:hypothetical protein
MNRQTTAQDFRRGLARSARRCLLIVFALTMLLSPSAADADAHTRRNSVDGRTFNGVQARFELANPILRKNDSLKIRLVLRNASNRTVDFAYTATILHIRVYDAAKKEIDQRVDAPILQPVAYPVRLAPGKDYETVLTVDLWTYYDLLPGEYYLRFYYDLRLLDEKVLTADDQKLYRRSPLILWDTRYYPFRVAR